MSHCKRFTLRGFLSQRFLYSRDYAGSRFATRGPLVRAAAAALSVWLPPLLIGRLLRQIAPRRALWAPGLRAAPYLLLFFLVWACGELVGYAAGAGDALRRIE